MKCIHRKEIMRRGTAPFHVDRKNYHRLLDTVPAWVCTQCGEAYFEEAQVDAIQAAVRSLDQQAEKLSVPA